MTDLPRKSVRKSDEDWRAQLTDLQYFVTRQRGNESPFTGAYWDSQETGAYACICCQTSLFDSRSKVKSVSGLATFLSPIKVELVEQVVDEPSGSTRLQCRCCEAHLGFLSPDPTSKSIQLMSINSASLLFHKKPIPFFLSEDKSTEDNSHNEPN